MFDLPRLEGVEGTARLFSIYADRSDRAGDAGAGA
jgi:hypothetical protein